jgi:transposase-like protein
MITLTEKKKSNEKEVGVPKRSSGEPGEPERSEGTPTGDTQMTRSQPMSVPNPEVPEKPKRRQYTAEYKLKILQEADTCREAGELGALLRREGLYSSHLITWRQQRQEGTLSGLRPKKRGPKPKEKNPLARRVADLERENRNLHRRLREAEIIIEFQKKVADVLGIPLNDPESEEQE